ncbi:MAG: GNAT family N-acetyltransferase [Labilithrix sp.]|nr:GNAT family N-acetyltransferase [Labilithrix sp.]MCW5809401.1 GNAT family N-acetyltransferase [Labilithrix sp.]
MLIRRLTPNDVAVLERLAEEDPDDDDDDDDAPAPGSAAALLADPSVLVWGAFDGEVPIGMLHCVTIRKHAARPLELLLYDVGVRERDRRRGVGRALLDAMRAWMKEHAVSEVWVLADNAGAVAFYESCGFARGDAERAVYMTREN